MIFLTRTFALTLVTAATLAAPLSHAQAVRTERNMSLALATQLAIDAVAACTASGHNVTATVVDRAGSVRAVMRADNAGPHTLEASLQKAFTSASAKNATLTMMEGAQKNPAATCAAEFEALTPYFYSSFEAMPAVFEDKKYFNAINNESHVTEKKKVIVLGSVPNRIGQGIEFDYCCVHGVLAIKEAGFEAIMMNCNPETVSTDFDIADKLYFEPVFWEHLRELIDHEKPEGVIVQLGGQTALKLAKNLRDSGIKIIGSSYDSMDIAEDRERFSDLLKELHIPYPEYGAAKNAEEAIEVAKIVGYPVLVRPSYVLVGQRMRIVIDDQELTESVVKIIKHFPDNNTLIDHFLDRAEEAEIDAIYDGEHVEIMGNMEHIEPAGIHSGDSNSVLPPYNLSENVIGQMKEFTEKIARALEIRGLINIQFAIKNEKVYVIERNPRASRSSPMKNGGGRSPL